MSGRSPSLRHECHWTYLAGAAEEPAMTSLRTRVAFVTATLAAIAAAPFAVAQTAQQSASTWQARPATYQVAQQSNVPIQMSDGVVLMADVYRPADANKRAVPGRFPVLLTQTPYNKANS